MSAALLQVAAYSLAQGVPLQNRGESHITVSPSGAWNGCCGTC